MIYKQNGNEVIQLVQSNIVTMTTISDYPEIDKSTFLQLKDNFKSLFRVFIKDLLNKNNLFINSKWSKI